MDPKSAMAVAASVVLVSASGIAALGTTAGVVDLPELGGDGSPPAAAEPAPTSASIPPVRVVERIVEVPSAPIAPRASAPSAPPAVPAAAGIRHEDDDHEEDDHDEWDDEGWDDDD